MVSSTRENLPDCHTTLASKKVAAGLALINPKLPRVENWTGPSSSYEYLSVLCWFQERRRHRAAPLHQPTTLVTDCAATILLLHTTMPLYSGNSSSSDHEELARRLQYMEQSSRPAVTRSGSGTSSSAQQQYHHASHQQEIQDREVAREFAQMDLLAARAVQRENLRSRTPSTDAGNSRTNRSSRGMYLESQQSSTSRRATNSRNRSFSPTALSSRTVGDPFDYTPGGAAAATSPQRLRPRRVYSTTSPRLHHSSGTYNDLFHNAGAGGGSVSPRRQTSTHNRYLSRSQSPTPQHGTTHRCSRSLGLIDHELLARAGLSYDGQLPTTTTTAVPQQRQTSATVGAPSTTGTSSYSRAHSNFKSTSDEDLARRMQELEDMGMGQLNSDRALESMENDDDDGDDDNNNGDTNNINHVMAATNNETTTTTNNNNKSGQEESDLARLIAESGTNVDDINDEVLQELLGLEASQKIKHVAAPDSNGSSSDFSSSTPSTGRSQMNNHDSLPATPQPAPRRVESAPDQRSKTSRIPSPIPPASSILPTIDGPPTDTLSTGGSPTKSKKKRRGFLTKLKGRTSAPNTPMLEDRKPPPSLPVPGGVPVAIPPPPGGSLSSSSHHQRSDSAMRQARSVSPINNTKGTISGIPTGIPAAGIHGVKPSAGHARNNSFSGSFRGTSMCAACGLTHGSFLKAFDRIYHPECFRCTTCEGKIDPNDQFKYTTDLQGRRHPHHRECYIGFAVSCAVCKQKLPMTAAGQVPFIRHPFFDDEKMCVRHAEEQHRRCEGCQRLEPRDSPFIDVMDGNRSVCPACCRSVVVDNVEAKPLWNKVLAFFENYLKLPVWGPLRNLPILLVGSETLLGQMREQNHIHWSSSHPLTSGLCLTEPSRRENEVSRYSSSSSSSNYKHKVDVISILCLTGLPSDLTASVLAHEATHAWIKMHPKYDINNPLPPQVEEGVAQLVAMLFLSEGLGPPPKPTPQEAQDGPSDEKLRQYFKFTIERETSDIYGNGYRRAAVAYRDIGIEALLTHILQYRDFPVT